MYVCVFPESVVSFLSHPVLPALLLPSGQQLFSANAICQWVYLLKLSFLPHGCGSLTCLYLHRYLFEVGGKEITDASRQLLEWEATELQVRICCQGAMTVLTVTLFSFLCGTPSRTIVFFIYNLFIFYTQSHKRMRWAIV